MKIVYLSSATMPSRTANSIHIMKMCQAFSAFGHSVWLTAKAVASSDDSIFAHYGIKNRFIILRNPLFSGVRYLGHISSLLSVLRVLLVRPNLVIARDPTAAYFSSLFRLPTSFEIHGPVRESGKRVFSQLLARLGIDEPPQPTRLIAQGEQLVAAACAMHDRIFRHGAEGRTVLLNQAGSGWNPVESTMYFDNRRIILVSRDPRDQFVELKQHKKVNCVEGFVDWYKQMQKHLGQIENSCLLNVSFEDFVRHNDGVVSDVCKHLHLSSKVNSCYNPDLSAINIGKYRKFVSQKELAILDKHLSEYFYND